MTTGHEKTEDKPRLKMSMKRRVLLSIGLPLWVLFSFIAAAVIIQLIESVLIDTGALPLGAVNESVRSALFAALVYTLSLVIAIGVPLKARNIRTTKQELGLARLPDWMDLALAPAGFIVATLLAGALVVATTALFPGFNAEQAQDVGFTDINQPYEYILAFITLVIVAPVAEEILVRGYLYGKMRKFVPIIVATIISSLLFSLMHGQWNVALSVLPMGVMLVVLREMTGSIWAGILMHMLKNGVAFYLLFINTSLLNTIGG